MDQNTGSTHAAGASVTCARNVHGNEAPVVGTNPLVTGHFVHGRSTEGVGMPKVTETATIGANDENGVRAMHTPPVVWPHSWEAARQEMLVKEKAFTRARDALAAERRRMPWMAVEKTYQFEGPQGKVGLLELFEGRR